VLRGLGWAKNSTTQTHSCTHWGYCSTERESENTHTHNRDGAKRESTEVLKEEEEDRGTSGIENEKDMM